MESNYGQELLANPNFLFFYPFTLAIVLLLVDFPYTMHYLLHFILGSDRGLLARAPT